MNCRHYSRSRNALNCAFRENMIHVLSEDVTVWQYAGNYPLQIPVIMIR